MCHDEARDNVEARMKVPEQFSRSTEYFSESQGEWVSIADLPMPHVLNIYKKHVRVPGFIDSPLGQALSRQLIPSRAVAKTMIATKGKCVYFAPVADKHVRSMFYRIGKALGVKIATTRKGNFIEATADRVVGEQVQVKIRHKNRFRGSGR